MGVTSRSSFVQNDFFAVQSSALRNQRYVIDGAIAQECLIVCDGVTFPIPGQVGNLVTEASWSPCLTAVKRIVVSFSKKVLAAPYLGVRLRIDITFVPQKLIARGDCVLFGLRGHEEKIILLVAVRVPIQFQWNGPGVRDWQIHKLRWIQAHQPPFLASFSSCSVAASEVINAVRIPIQLQRKQVCFVGGDGSKAAKQQYGCGQGE